ncbi:hypothetical protein [Tenacibaculum sp. SG-28]|uniref:hypothetical protein n=1 Tax=Tenacibaculum sp. SG-28 TaxID=754426 RepID=UPI000D449893|nr:hypothetical protein [Tenacibaculum sp. SG-28]PQJ20829.1 hypothetical protein BSU00_11015 [Tenacibaculum sp. SG-28]
MLRPIAPLVEYAINYDYIAKILCINKENLSLNCNGKCYVMKKLQQQQEEDFNSIQIVIKDYPIGFVELIGVANIEDTILLQNKQAFYKRIYTYLASFSIFHPPQF